jgi:hypothetical protein
MKVNAQVAPLARALRRAAAALVMIVATMTRADTLWTGPNTNFTQSASSKTDVLVPGAVSFTRDATEVLFNPAGGDAGPSPSTPSDTEWAFGILANYTALDYQTFGSLRNGDLAALIIGHPMVVHLVKEDIYLSLTFSAWGQHGVGGFSYSRSTPAALAPSPTVSITSPANGAVFAAPANVKIGAAATVASGTVTNVAFFGNATSLGAVQTAPFSITTGSLAAGAYALAAVATAAGVSATSSVVNITVVSPVAITLTSQTITNSQFAFNYTGTPGLSYVVQNSSNLVNWLPIVTNVASTNPVHFTDSLIPNGARYYRVGQVPNP